MYMYVYMDVYMDDCIEERESPFIEPLIALCTALGTARVCICQYGVRCALFVEHFGRDLAMIVCFGSLQFLAPHLNSALATFRGQIANLEPLSTRTYLTVWWDDHVFEFTNYNYLVLDEPSCF